MTGPGPNGATSWASPSRAGPEPGFRASDGASEPACGDAVGLIKKASLRGVIDVTDTLDELVRELRDCDRQERIELLLDLARELPPLPDHLSEFKDEAHRVPECQSPVFLFVETESNRIRLYADVPVEAPTVRGFVSILVQGLDGSTAEEILATPNDLIERSGMLEILGMQRVSGLHGVLRRLKTAVARLRSPQDSHA